MWTSTPDCMDNQHDWPVGEVTTGSRRCSPRRHQGCSRGLWDAPGAAYKLDTSFHSRQFIGRRMVPQSIIDSDFYPVSYEKNQSALLRSTVNACAFLNTAFSNILGCWSGRKSAVGSGHWAAPKSLEPVCKPSHPLESGRSWRWKRVRTPDLLKLCCTLFSPHSFSEHSMGRDMLMMKMCLCWMQRTHQRGFLGGEFESPGLLFIPIECRTDFQLANVYIRIDLVILNVMLSLL
jgi:hypothetical protein